MKRSTKKITAIMAALLATATVGASAAMPVFAENDATAATNLSALVEGTKLQFNKVLQGTEGDQATVKASFDFTLTPADADDKAEKGIALSTTETDGSLKTTIDFTGLNTGDEKLDDTTHSYTKTGTFDLSDLFNDNGAQVGAKDFDHAGVYHYTAQEVKPETESTAIKNYDETVFDVYVTVVNDDDAANGLKIASIVAYKTTASEDEQAAATKTKVPLTFTNELDSETLKIEKEVTGELGNKNQEFTFALGLKSGVMEAGTVIKATVYDKATNTSSEKEITVSENGETTTTFTLKDSEYLVIDKLLCGTEAVVTETKTDGYTAYYTVNANGTETVSEDANGTTENLTITQAVAKTDDDDATEDATIIHVRNDSTGAPDTGVALIVAPAAIAGGLAAAGVVYFVVKRKIRK
jgi:hypothetical protein